MKIRQAVTTDCRAIAELALIAGDGIPGYFWAQNKKADQTLVDTGALIAAEEGDNFSYLNVEIAETNNQVAGMLLAYRLPPAEENNEDPAEFAEFVQPLIELEQCVPDSYYINMLACYENYRDCGIGTRLLKRVDQRAMDAGCDLISIEVFDSNQGALKLYQRLGYKIIEQRAMIASNYHAAGQVLLLTKPVAPDDRIEPN